MSEPKKPQQEQELPVRPGTSSEPNAPREIENPGDPGPTVLVPPEPQAVPPRPEDCTLPARR